MSEYESSVRLPHQAKRTTLGRHISENHFGNNNLKTSFKFSIIDKGKDSLECFLKEGLHIKNKNPRMNGKFNNGFLI